MQRVLGVFTREDPLVRISFSGWQPHPCEGLSVFKGHQALLQKWRREPEIGLLKSFL